jgi:putative transposase
MPVRNTVKNYLEAYYHIYNRGICKELLFIDDQDYTVFLGLLKRYLGNGIDKKLNRVKYPNYSRDIDLLAYCLMPNHYHLFVYQHKADAIADFMRSLGVSYSMYFNKKYKRQGSLFQQRYKAVDIKDDSQLLHITRYIHLNPTKYKTYKWSSYPYYISDKKAEWLKPSTILDLFDGDKEKYKLFIADYKSYKDALTDIKDLLIDN